MNAQEPQKQKPKATLEKSFDLDEWEFYILYFRSLNLMQKNEKKVLRNQEIQLASHICCKPLDFTMETKKTPPGKSKKYELASDMNIQKNAVYTLINNLEKKGILSVDEDGIYRLPADIQELRKAVKSCIEKGVGLTVDYVLKFNLDV